MVNHKDEKRVRGASFAVKNSLLIIEPSIGDSERTIPLRVNTTTYYVTLISVYVSDFMETSDVKDVFSENLCVPLLKLPPEDQVIYSAISMLEFEATTRLGLTVVENSMFGKVMNMSRYYLSWKANSHHPMFPIPFDETFAVVICITRYVCTYLYSTLPSPTWCLSLLLLPWLCLCQDFSFLSQCLYRKLQPLHRFGLTFWRWVINLNNIMPMLSGIPQSLTNDYSVRDTPAAFHTLSLDRYLDRSRFFFPFIPIYDLRTVSIQPLSIYTLITQVCLYSFVSSLVLYSPACLSRPSFVSPKCQFLFHL